MRLRSRGNVMKKICAFLAVVLSLAFAGVTFAQEKKAADKPAAEAAKPAAAPEAKKEEAKPAPTPNKGDIAWMLTSTALVLMMSVPALALFYGGMVRAKNTLSMLMQVFVVFSLVTVLWCIYGYSLAFTEGNAYFGGFDRLFLKGTFDSTKGEFSMAATFSKNTPIPELVYVAFQATFAAITVCLIVGAFAERMKFSAVLLFSALWFTFSYAPIAHMVWFWPGPDAYTAANVVDATNAKAGWFGFNAGSALEANSSAALAFINTFLATACAVLSWTFGEWLIKGKPSMLGAASGAVAGLVAITPAAGNVGIPGAFVIGLAAGLVCLWGVSGLKKMLKVDDSLDVFGVHAVGGILGALLTGVFNNPDFGGPGITDYVTGKIG